MKPFRHSHAFAIFLEQKTLGHCNCVSQLQEERSPSSGDQRGCCFDLLSLVLVCFGAPFFKRLTCNGLQVELICWQGSDTETMEHLEEESLDLNFRSPNFVWDLCGTTAGAT